MFEATDPSRQAAFNPVVWVDGARFRVSGDTTASPKRYNSAQRDWQGISRFNVRVRATTHVVSPTGDAIETAQKAIYSMKWRAKKGASRPATINKNGNTPIILPGPVDNSQPSASSGQARPSQPRSGTGSGGPARGTASARAAELGPTVQPSDAGGGQRSRSTTKTAGARASNSGTNTTKRRTPIDNNKTREKKPPKLSRQKRPPNMSLEEWQIALRRQFGREQNFTCTNLGSEPIFSEFRVHNPQSKGTYEVHIRGARLGENYCTCADFATNTLGTCKHIEFTLAQLEELPNGKKKLNEGFQPPYSEIYLHYGTRREVRFRPGDSCHVELARLASSWFDSHGTLRAENFARFEKFLAIAQEYDPDFRCQNDVLAFIAEVRDANIRAQRVQEFFPQGVDSPAFEGLVNEISLYRYQRDAVLFALKAGRCLIGDEMGLGKTVQAIAIAEVMANLFGVQRVLIICPTSLKHQWQREIARFTQRSLQVIVGMRLERKKLFNTDTFFKITNYDTIHTDLDVIDSWAPDLVILDEAQRIKNWSTRTARSVKRVNSPYAIVLTGTPLENRLEELISIVQFVDRFRLGPTFRLLDEHQVRDDFGKVIGYRNLNRVGETLAPLLIRRQKDQVLDQLPERIDTNIFVPMTEPQMAIHAEAMERVARIVQKWRAMGFLTESDQRKLMVGLQTMRMSCDSTYLVDHETDYSVKPREAGELLAELLENSATKVVIFSQWLRMHDLMVREIKKRGWDYVLFHGSVPGENRRDLIDRFRDDPKCRIFLSTDAGGVGLNLQHASVVMNMDMPWNPAVLEQRVGRIHRIGQKLAVRVINFIAQGSIEEGMLNVLTFKRNLFAGVLDGGEKDIALGDKLEKFMKTVEAATTSIPETLLEDAEAAARAEAEEDGSYRGGGASNKGPRPPAPPPSTGKTVTPPGTVPGLPTGGPNHPFAGGHPAQPGGSTAPPTNPWADWLRGPNAPPAPPEGGPTAPGPSVPPFNPGIPPGTPESTTTGAPPPVDPWASLLQAGMTFIQQFAAATAGNTGAAGNSGNTGQGSPTGNTAATWARNLVRRDEATGETYLHLPSPPPEIIDQALRAVGSFLENLRRP